MGNLLGWGVCLQLPLAVAFGPNSQGMAGGLQPVPGSFSPGMLSAGPMGLATGMASGQQLNMPSTTIVLHGMFNVSQVNLAKDPEFFADIHTDVEQECRNYGS